MMMRMRGGRLERVKKDTGMEEGIDRIAMITAEKKEYWFQYQKEQNRRIERWTCFAGIFR